MQARIIADGMLRGKLISIDVTQQDDGVIAARRNGRADALVLDTLVSIGQSTPMANHYIAPSGSMLSIYSALSSIFFDKLVDIEVMGDIGQIPDNAPEGAIY